MALHIALAAGFLLGQVSANAPLARTPLASTPVAAQPSIVCRTELGTVSVAAIPTSTVTHTSYDAHPVVVYSTIQDTVTVTPTASWLSLTEYATTTVTTTADTITDTFSTTSTQYTTVTDTLTLPPVTATSVTSISVLSTATSTVSALAGVTPIVDTMASPTAFKREEQLSEDSQDSCPNWIDDYQYATAVECVATVVVKTTVTSTVTGSPATATAAEPTSTTTTTSTVTSSSTVLPTDASTTLSYSTLLTITETSTAPVVTSTVTSSTTVTSGVTTTAYYAACATNNIANTPLSSDYGSLAGQYIYEVELNNIPGEAISAASASSAYDCCVACQQNPQCAFSYFFVTSSPFCYVLTTTTCSSSTYGTAITEASSAGALALSNGPCGHIIT